MLVLWVNSLCYHLMQDLRHLGGKLLYLEQKHNMLKHTAGETTSMGRDNVMIEDAIRPGKEQNVQQSGLGHQPTMPRSIFNTLSERPHRWYLKPSFAKTLLISVTRSQPLLKTSAPNQPLDYPDLNHATIDSRSSAQSLAVPSPNPHLLSRPLSFKANLKIGHLSLSSV